MFRSLITIFIMVLITACVPDSPIVQRNDLRPANVITEHFADSLWNLRSDVNNAHNALRAYIELASDTSAISIWAKLSRAYYFTAHFLEKDPVRRDSLYMEGYEVSQKILNRDSDYRQLLFSTGDEKMAIRGLDQRYVEALYWGMANYGQWLATKGLLVRLGQREIIWSTLEHIHELDSTYYFGAYYRYKGALLCRDPMGKTMIDEAKASFETAIRMYPDYLGNYTLMAEYYCSLTRDKDLFYSLLTKVITSETNENLPYHAENKYERMLAERLMIKAEQEQWFTPQDVPDTLLERNGGSFIK